MAQVKGAGPAGGKASAKGKGKGPSSSGEGQGAAAKVMKRPAAAPSAVRKKPARQVLDLAAAVPIGSKDDVYTVPVVPLQTAPVTPEPVWFGSPAPIESHVAGAAQVKDDDHSAVEAMEVDGNTEAHVVEDDDDDISSMTHPSSTSTLSSGNSSN